jgi:CRISPR/Cas system type I-B associated protein Csh2 (Cas7 group RAMP superfamily)
MVGSLSLETPQASAAMAAIAVKKRSRANFVLVDWFIYGFTGSSAVYWAKKTGVRTRPTCFSLISRQKLIELRKNENIVQQYAHSIEDHVGHPTKQERGAITIN